MSELKKYSKDLIDVDKILLSIDDPGLHEATRQMANAYLSFIADGNAKKAIISLGYTRGFSNNIQFSLSARNNINNKLRYIDTPDKQNKST